MLSQYVSPQYALALLEDVQGRAYLLKDRVADIDDVVDAIRAVAGGGSVIDSKVVDELVQARSRSCSPLDHLTPREKEILGEMATGKSNAAIASALVLSERAVEKHINSIFRSCTWSRSPTSTGGSRPCCFTWGRGEASHTLGG